MPYCKRPIMKFLARKVIIGRFSIQTLRNKLVYYARNIDC